MAQNQSLVGKLRAYSGNEPYIFISYAHRDRDLVLPVVAQLMSSSYRVWFDEGIDPGTEWDTNIAEHVENCAYFIAFVSKNYLASDNCKDELNFVRDLKKPQLLVYLEAVQLPSGMQMRMGRLQAIHKYTYSNERDFYEKLFDAKDISLCLPRSMLDARRKKELEAAEQKRQAELAADRKRREMEEAARKQKVIDDAIRKRREAEEAERKRKEAEKAEGMLIENGVLLKYTGSAPKVIIPPSVKSIGPSVFAERTDITSISIPESVTSIGESAFKRCSGLTSITLPEHLSRIDSFAFYGCSGLTSLSIPKRVRSVGMEAFCYCTSLTSFTFPEGVTTLDFHALWGCSGLTEVTIPNNITYIAPCTFLGCSALTSISIPASVTEIGPCVFDNCSSLASITVEPGNPRYRSSGNCLIDIKEKKLLSGCKNSVIPNDGSITSICREAFSRCTGLVKITIPQGVTSIGYKAFYACTGLTKITLPQGTTFIGENAFNGCKGLTSITIPKSLRKIDKTAFGRCANLTDIRYEGTKMAWRFLKKRQGWDEGVGSYTVHCTNGDIVKK